MKRPDLRLVVLSGLLFAAFVAVVAIGVPGAFDDGKIMETVLNSQPVSIGKIDEKSQGQESETMEKPDLVVQEQSEPVFSVLTSMECTSLTFGRTGAQMVLSWKDGVIDIQITGPHTDAAEAFLKFLRTYMHGYEIVKKRP